MTTLYIKSEWSWWRRVLFALHLAKAPLSLPAQIKKSWGGMEGL